MAGVTLKAHFDGEHITLDEPYDLRSGAILTVTVLPAEVDAEREDWANAGAVGLARAYADDEPEYTAKDIKK